MNTTPTKAHGSPEADRAVIGILARARTPTGKFSLPQAAAGFPYQLRTRTSSAPLTRTAHSTVLRIGSDRPHHHTLTRGFVGNVPLLSVKAQTPNFPQPVGGATQRLTPLGPKSDQRSRLDGRTPATVPTTSVRGKAKDEPGLRSSFSLQSAVPFRMPARKPILSLPRPPVQNPERTPQVSPILSGSKSLDAGILGQAAPRFTAPTKQPTTAQYAPRRGPTSPPPQIAPNSFETVITDMPSDSAQTLIADAGAFEELDGAGYQIHLDGMVLGRWITDFLASSLSRPERGPTMPNATMSSLWPNLQTLS